MMKRMLSVVLCLMMVIACFAGVAVSADEVEYVAGLGLVASDWSTNTDFRENSSVQTTIIGDGTYTLTYEGACADLGILVVDIVGAQSALDAEGKTYQVSDVALTIDGNEIAVNAEKVLTGDLEENGNYRIELQNMYGSTKDDPALDATIGVNESLSLTFKLTTIDKTEEDVTAELPEEFELFIAYGGDKEAENDWGYQYYGADSEGITAVTAKLKTGETATVSLTFDSANVNSWFFAPCLIADGVSAIGGIDFTITCKIDGEEVAIDMDADADGKTWWTEDTGDYKGNCVRLAGGYNEWATQYIAEPASFTTIEYTVTLNAVTGASGSEEDDVPTISFDPAGKYNAYLLLQTPNWTYRDAWNSANGIGSDYWGQWIYGNETNETYGVVTDTEVCGNGTYRVSVTDFGTIFADDFAAAGQDNFNIIGVSTNIPLSEDVVITNVKLIIDGAERKVFDNAYLDPDATEYVTILLQNIWNDDVKELPYYPAPSESLVVEFTVSGFNYDNAANDSGSDVTEPEATEPVDDTTDDNNSNAMVYVIIAVAAVAVVAVVVVIVVKNKKKAN